MYTSLPILALATLLAFGAGNARMPAPTRPTVAGPTSIAALNQQFAEAMQQQDVAKATACLAKNARLLLNMSPVLSGRDSLSTYWLKGSFSTDSNLKFTPLQTVGDATMGYSTGYYTYDFKPTATYPKGASGRGSFMSIAHKEGATWLITYVHIAQEPLKANK
jgi:ketosteroid isomerase-like protein